MFAVIGYVFGMMFYDDYRFSVFFVKFFKNSVYPVGMTGVELSYRLVEDEDLRTKG